MEKSKHDFLRLKHQVWEAVILDLRPKTLFFAKHTLKTSMQIVIKSCTVPEYTIISLWCFPDESVCSLMAKWLILMWSANDCCFFPRQFPVEQGEAVLIRIEWQNMFNV